MYHSLMLLAGMLCLFHGFYLPSVHVLAGMFIVSSLFLLFRQFGTKLIVVFLLGYCWAGLFANYSASQNSLQSLINQPLEVSGCLLNIKNHSSNYQRLLLEAEEIFLNDQLTGFKGKISLGNYQPLNTNIKPGWCGQFTVTLKPVHGRLNQHGFDYEAWAYVQNIKAVGVLKQVNESYPGQSLVNRYLQFRSKLADDLGVLTADSPVSPLIISLALGNRNLMTEDQWSVLRRTGTSHLLAISGLHIGLVFWFTALISSLCWRAFIKACLILPAQKAGWIMGLIVSGIYLILTGLPLSGQRAWIMLVITTALLLGDEKTSFSRCFSLALVIILIIWPSSVLSVGFWFSFAAVGLILLQFIHVDVSPTIKPAILNAVIIQKVALVLILQVVLSLSMLPLSLLFFGELSLISPLANIIAIPLVSFFILPQILSGLVLLVCGWSDFSALCFDQAQTWLNYLYQWLNNLVELNWAWMMPVLYQQISIMLIFIGIILWRYYRLWPGKWLLGLLVLPLIMNPKPNLQSGEFKLEVFDVGQGLAVWIQTRDKNLLVDTGFDNASGFSYFDSVIYPVLSANVVAKLDAVVISHGDADHSGGLIALMNSRLKPEEVFTSESNLDQGFKFCRAGYKWNWNKVSFEFLTQHHVSGENNRSCVLKISGQYGSALLPGDIEKEAERSLVANYDDRLATQVLIAPHHGSRTSSTYSFLQSVNPELVIFSAGYLNRYSHPAQKIINRYRDKDISLLNTACHGQVTVKFLASGIQSASMRENKQPFWRHQCTNIAN